MQERSRLPSQMLVNDKVGEESASFLFSFLYSCESTLTILFWWLSVLYTQTANTYLSTQNRWIILPVKIIS